MQPFPGKTESLSDRNLRLSYFAEENGRVLVHGGDHAWRRALGRKLIDLGSRLATASEPHHA